MELYNCPTIDYRKAVYDNNCTVWMFDVFSRNPCYSQHPFYKAYWRLSKPAVKKGRRPI